MRSWFIAVVLILGLVSSVHAASLGDLQAAVLQEDYDKVASLAKELAAQKLPKADMQQVVYYMGLSQLRLGDYAKGQETFKKLIIEKPEGDLLDKASVGLIDALSMQGYYEQALREANTLLSKRPDSEMRSLFYLKAARANLKLARWSKAKDLLTKILVEYPESFEAGIAKQLLEEKQYYTVQVGAFIEKARAERLVQELIVRKEYAYLVETKMADGRTFYRVRVGQLSSLKDAQELEGKLSGLGYPTLIYP
ncbi:MAG: SPOR domain-containing protein [Candidatus Omnitrophica bacterium]|nr:SPOR domain-containing protein [Candidatus Omnitrophota bacterium]